MHDSSNLTGENVRTGTLHGTLMGAPPTAALSGDVALGTISGQGDNDDTAAVKGNLGLNTVGRENLVDEAVDVSKLSSVLLADLVTEGELTSLLERLRADDEGGASPNDGDGFLQWNHLEGVPSDVMDGDDNGSAVVQQLREALRGTSSDTTPNDSDDLVSLDEIMGLTTSGGDGRIVGAYLQDGTVTAVDLAPGAVQGGPGGGILDGTISSDDLNLGVIARFDALEARLAGLSTAPASGDTDRVSTTRLSGWNLVTVALNPGSVPATSRLPQVIPVSGLQVGDFVTVSPPAALNDDLLFVGHDVEPDPADPSTARVVVYLYNPSPAEIDDTWDTWKIQYLDLTP